MIEVKRHIVLRRTDSGVAQLILDSPGRVNVLSSAAMEELHSALHEVARDPKISALIVFSNKQDNFCSGADLHEIIKFCSQTEARAMSYKGQAVLRKLSELGKPVVAGINGTCLGGGLELAMWCHARIATTSATTILGLPEVRLGIIPGLGGTQRLPRLVGLKSSLEMILSSEPISANSARSISLVDEIVEPDKLISSLEHAALGLVETQCYPEWSPYEKQDRSKENSLFAMAERSVRMKTKGQYPAPARVLQVMREGLAEGIDRGLELEAEAFGELAVSGVSRNLIFLFFSAEMSKQLAKSLAAKAESKVATVGVIGGGVMGSGIAHLAASCGYQVVLRESDEQHLRQAENRLQVLNQRKQPPSDSNVDSHKASNITFSLDDRQLSGADLVVEAVYEDLALKRDVFKQVSNIVSPGCVLATNTSCLAIRGIADAIKNSDKVVGLHFFHPVERMPLVEVVTHDSVDPAAVTKATSFVLGLDKTPIAVKDGPGFLVNRLLCTYLSQAARLGESNVPINWLEDAAVTFGMPMGPFALMDEVGLDLSFKVAEDLYEQIGQRMQTPGILYRVKDRGLRGKKTGSGFYLWDDSGKRQQLNPALLADDLFSLSENKPDAGTIDWICDRLVLPMIDEAARCLTDKIVRRPRELDLAMVLGIGFPAFRGGPLRYADELGIQTVVSRLEKIFGETQPEREVAPYLVQMISSQRRFYSLSIEAGAG